MSDSDRIKPSLFDLLDEYSAQIRSGEVQPATSLPRTSRVLVFCENLFNQFFANVLGQQITGFGSAAQRNAARLRKSGELTDASARTVVAVFEQFCDIYPDVLGAGYGGSPGTFRRFHRNLLPRLLRSFLTWARAGQELALATRIAEAQDAYSQALEEAKWLS